MISIVMTGSAVVEDSAALPIPTDQKSTLKDYGYSINKIRAGFIPNKF
jgi:hypothetical protein